MSNLNMTAKISCFARAYHNKNNDIKIYDDPLSLKILSADEYQNISVNMCQGIKFFNPNFKGNDKEALEYIVNNHLAPTVLGRSAFVADELTKFKNSYPKGQYLVMASGYDTSAYNSDYKAFELDQNFMIEDKIKRISIANIPNKNISYVKTDFTNKKWINDLLITSFNRTIPTFCSLLGISYYLSNNQFLDMLKKIALILPKNSMICFDYPTTLETNASKLKQQLAKEAGETMKSQYDIKQLSAKLTQVNLHVLHNLDQQTLTAKYFLHFNQLNQKNKIIAPNNVNYCILIKQ